MRLAEHVAHTVHVDAMMDSMTHEQFDWWCAKDEIEPIGHSTRMLGYIASLLSAALGVKATSDEICQAFTPWVDDNYKAPAPTPENVDKLAELILGGL